MSSEVKKSHPELPDSLPRAKISAFVICKNEEDHIEECLESLAFCDEVIVIDSFSTDSTVEKAEATGAKVIQREWPGYKAQKAFGLASTENEWVINLDADERVSEGLRDSILEVLQKEENNPKEEIVGYYINRVVFFLDAGGERVAGIREYRLRFFKKSRVTWGGVDPHEKPIPHGKTANIKGELYHFTYEDLDDQFQRLQQHATMAAIEEAKKNKPFKVSSLIVNPLWRMIKFYIFKRGYREGVAGVIVAIAEANYTFIKYAKVWELNQVKSNPGSDKPSNSGNSEDK